MLTHDYQYNTVLNGSLRNAWTVDDCFQDRTSTSPSRSCRNGSPASARSAASNGDEKRMLNQIRGNTYCHIFAFVEEYIVPMVEEARADVYGEERGCARCSGSPRRRPSTELMFRAVPRVRKGFGIECGVIPGREAVARSSSERRALLAAADEHDRVVHPAPLHRARARRGAAR